MENKSDWIPIAVLYAHKDNFAERTYLTPNACIYKDKRMKINPIITYHNTKPSILYYDYKF